MWAIFGKSHHYASTCGQQGHLVAIFDDKDKAKKYIEDSKQDAVKEAEKEGVKLNGLIYKKGSLCRPYNYCWVGSLKKTFNPTFSG